MTLKLERGDLLQLEPISYSGTLKLFPLGKKNKQKLVVGDDSGKISCYEFKKGEPQVVFQTKAHEGPITCVALGGPASKRDKIFFSHGQTIRGISKKATQFFELISSVTETFQNIATEDTRIWAGCENIYNLYQSGVETDFFISRDRINHLIVAHVTRDSDFDTVLACQDSCIRVIHGSTLFLEIPTDFPVTTLAFVEIESDPSSMKTPTGLIYGLSTGALCLVQVFSNGEFTHIWTIEDGQKRSAITSICLYDLDKDKSLEIVVGRDDGRVEVYKQQPESLFAVPYKVVEKDIGESVRAIECGIVSTPEFPEIVVASYSGKVISFTTEPVHTRATEDSYGRSILTISNENRIKHLKKEIEEMKKKIKKDKEALAKTGGRNANPDNVQKPAPEFPVNSKFSLDTRVAAYVLTVELQSPIDLIILRSPVVLDLVETDTGSSVLSVTPPQLLQQCAGGPAGAAGAAGEDLGKFVAVFRCQSQEKRIALTLRTNEGEFGNLHITIVADTNPKAAKIVKYDLKPLSLHTKVYALTPEEAARPRNVMKYTGTMQLATLHEWVQAIFPDVPPRLDEGVLDQVYYFRNSFTGATTTAEFRQNEITFKSENASTIAIIKENITRLANYRRISLQESVTPVNDSIASFLDLIRPKLEYQFSLARKMELVDAVQEIAMIDNAGGASANEWLSEEYKDILRDQEQIRQQYKGRDKSMQYLSGILTDLFADWNRLHGVDARQKLPALQQLITAADMAGVLRTFQEVSAPGRGRGFK